MKSTSVPDITHEMRPPSTLSSAVIRGYADPMAERLAEIEDASALEYAEPIRRAGQRLLDTIGACSTFRASNRAPSSCNRRKSTWWRWWSGRSRISARGRAKKGVGPFCQIDEPDATVLFDEHCLSDAIIELLENAIEFTEEGSVFGTALSP